MRGLEYQTVPIAFNQGLDTRTQQKLVIPGKWTDLLNLSLSIDNTPRTRDGHSALVASNNGNSLFTRGNELLSIAGPAVTSISTALGAAQSVPGVPGYVGISKTEIQRNTAVQDVPDMASSGAITAYVWRTKNAALSAITGLGLTVVDETTGTVFQSNITLRTSATVSPPRIVATSDAFFIFYRDGTSIFCRVITFAAPGTLGVETALITSVNIVSSLFDAIGISGTATAAVAYLWADGTTSVRDIIVQRVGTTPSIVGAQSNVITEANVNEVKITGVTVCAFAGGTSGAVIVASAGAGTSAIPGLVAAVVSLTTGAVSVAATRLSATVNSSNTPSGLCAVAEPNEANAIRVFRDVFGDGTFSSITQLIFDTSLAVVVLSTAVIASAGVVAGTNAGTLGPFLRGKPFANGANVFLPVWCFNNSNGLLGAASNPRSANAQNTFFVIDCGRGGLGFFDPAAVCGRALSGTVGTATLAGSGVTTWCCGTPAIGSSFGIAIPELTTLVLSNSQNISPTGIVRLTMTPNTTLPLPRAQLGESAYVAGGQLSMYDGQAVAEQAFPMFPEGIGLVAGGAGTGTMTDGVHQVVAVYSWVDNAGQRHQSSPSLPVTVTVASGANTGSITVTVPTLLVSQKTNVEVQIYCTIAAGLSFFRSLSTLGKLNTTAAQTVTFLIQDSDANLASQELLYTQPNASPTTLANFAPAPCTYVWTAHRRLWFDKADKPGWFGYSQEYVNNVGLQFSPDLEDNLPAESGGFVAGAEMDEKVVIFGRRRIYVMFGSGPNSSGSFNNYSHPQDIQADLGCSDPMSVLAEVPQGIIFKAQKGWHLLGRDLSVKYIGEGVAQFDTNSVTAAVMLEDRKECRFVTSGAGGDVQGTTLVFSYLIDQWSYFTQTNGDGYFPVDAAWWPVAGSGSGRYITISTTAGTNQDTPGVYTDQPGGSPPVGILTRARTSWLHLSKLEGFQRVRWLYFSGTASGATPNSSLQINVDYDDEYGQTAPGAYSYSVNLFSAFFPWTGASIDIRSKLRRMKCKSIAFTFIEGGAIGVPRLAGIQAMALQIGMRSGVNRLPVAQSVG